MKAITVIDYGDMGLHYCPTFHCIERITHFVQLPANATEHRFSSSDAARDRILEQAISRIGKLDSQSGNWQQRSEQKVIEAAYTLYVLMLDICDGGRAWSRMIAKAKKDLYQSLREN